MHSPEPGTVQHEGEKVSEPGPAPAHELTREPAARGLDAGDDLCLGSALEREIPPLIHQVVRDEAVVARVDEPPRPVLVREGVAEVVRLQDLGARQESPARETPYYPLARVGVGVGA